ncbi:hypothetical protein A3K73_09430 [Candidatus Pacearchaeota archaeon RBG_13_36_9]|nr:MAG: hypothetical protein A3K73_09430 [Candidatus Pacearchaeota archaeon RBG_13_36_9]
MSLETNYWKDVFNFKGLRKPTDEKTAAQNREIVGKRLAAYGFSKDCALLQELDLTVRLSPNEFYIRMQTQNPLNSARAIGQAHGEKVKIVEEIRAQKVIGAYIPVKFRLYEDAYKANVVFVKKPVKGPNFFAGWGHEDGHFLFQTNRQHLVYQRFSVSPQHSSQLTTEEDFCVFCGYIAMHVLPLQITQRSLLRTFEISDPKIKLENAGSERKRRLLEEEIRRAERDSCILAIAKEALL